MLEGLSIATSGLYAAQRGLDVVSHNIANANTPGYSRQEVVQRAARPTIGGIAPLGPGSFGNGVEVQQVRQLRDVLVDASRQSALGAQGAARQSASAAAQLEGVLGPLDSGLSTDLDAFWSAWNDLSMHPEQQASRQGVLSAGARLASGITQAYAAIDDVATQAGNRLLDDAGQVNTLASTVARLNQQILETVASGGQPNDLVDQRTAAIDRLASLTGATTRTNGMMVDVVVNGSLLVGGVSASPMAVGGTPPTATVGGAAMSPGGEMGVLVGLAGTGLNPLRQRLDLLASGLRDAVNSAHAAGRDLDGNPGIAFFTGTGGRDLAVNAALTPRGIAASASGASADGNQALAIAGLRNASVIATVDAPTTPSLNAVAAIAELTATLGTQAAAANRTQDAADAAVSAADARRDEISGVSVDEEMTSMLRYQRAYEASARVVTTMDEMLDVLINRLGIVGR